MCVCVCVAKSPEGEREGKDFSNSIFAIICKLCNSFTQFRERGYQERPASTPVDSV